MAGQGIKKRWRIRGIRKSKSSSKSDGNADSVKSGSTTSESSDRSSLSHESFFHEPENSNNINEDNMDDIPAAMSDVDDSDSDSIDDVYLDHDNDPKSTAAPLHASQPKSVGDDSPTIKPVEPNIVNHDHDDFDRTFEDDMRRHEAVRRNRPHYSEELPKISEERQYSYSEDGSDDKDNKSTTGTYNKADYKMTPQNELDDNCFQTQSITEPFVQDNFDDEGIDLPSHRDLSKELGKIVSTEHYSVEESLLALERLSTWARTQDSNLLKHLLTYGGVVKVIDFLNECLENETCQGEILVECIQKAADVICNVCFVGKHGINEDIAVVNGTVVVKYLGVQTLLQASEVYNTSSDKNNPMALKAVESVWNAIMNVYCNAEAAMTKTISMLVVNASIETMSSVGAIDHPIAAETLANVFNCLYRITYHDFITEKEFERLRLLTHSLSVFQRDVTSSEGDEELLEEAFSFLYGCHEKELMSTGSDYERLLPLCVMGLQEFAHFNDNIREWATKLLDGACSNVANKESIMMAEGAIEALAPLLTAKDVGSKEKEELRQLMRKILAPA